MALGRQRELHAILKSITPKVYFQPPANVKMEFPCIVYHRDFAETKFADNLPYSNTRRYLVTVIDQDPDSGIPDKVAALPMTTYIRWFASDNLNHDIYQLYF